MTYLIVFLKFFGVNTLAIYLATLFTSDTQKFKHFFDFFMHFIETVISVSMGFLLALLFTVLYVILKFDSVSEVVLFSTVFILVFIYNFILLKYPKPFYYERELKKRKKQLTRVFEKYTPIIPDVEIKNKDIAHIKIKLQSLVSNFTFGNESEIDPREVENFERLKSFFALGDTPPRQQIQKDSWLHRSLITVSKTLDISFISYSPNGKYFVCLLTYSRYTQEEDRNISSTRIAFGEKLVGSINLYLYKCFNKSIQEGEEDTYKFFTGWRNWKSIMNNLDLYSLRRIYDYPQSNPMDPKFWKDPNFFSYTTIDGEKHLRFKTFNQIGYRVKDEPYELRESLVLPYTD